jgi:hypothetical protein
MLERFRSKQADPAVLERQAALKAISDARDARQAKRKAARDAEASRLAAERAAVAAEQPLVRQRNGDWPKRLRPRLRRWKHNRRPRGMPTMLLERLGGRPRGEAAPQRQTGAT